MKTASHLIQFRIGNREPPFRVSHCGIVRPLGCRLLQEVMKFKVLARHNTISTSHEGILAHLRFGDFRYLVKRVQIIHAHFKRLEGNIPRFFKEGYKFDRRDPVQNTATNQWRGILQRFGVLPRQKLFENIGLDLCFDFIAVS